MRRELMVLWMALFPVVPAMAQMSVVARFTNASIGINVSLYPELVRVPGYPVYYAQQLNSNYFFYDGLYWVYQGDNWYSSSWYDGPWWLVAPEEVPLYILRVPVRYYRQPPMYFQSWQPNAPPHWGEHWGNAWAQRRSGWDHWNRDSAPAPAPLPLYQRNYSGARYPGVEQQRALQSQNYHYQPHAPAARQQGQSTPVQGAPAPGQRGTQRLPPERHSGQLGAQRPNLAPLHHQEISPASPQARPTQQRPEHVERSNPMQAPPQAGGKPVQQDNRLSRHNADQNPQPTSRDKEAHGKGEQKEPGRGQGHEKERDQADDHKR